MAVVHNGMQTRISRRDDGTRDGYLSIDGYDRGASPPRTIASLIGGLTATDFDLIFSPPLSRDPNPEALLEAARRAGFELVSRRDSSARLRRLQQRLDGYHAELERQARADAEQRAEQERQARADAERELARLRAQLASGD